MDKRTKTEVLYTENLPYNIEQTARVGALLGRNYYKNVVKSILDIDEYTILSLILSNPNLSQSDLSKLMYKGKAHIGKILSAMEVKGYIKRIAVTDNNMMKKLTKITSKGKKLFDETYDVFRNLAEEVLEDFTDEEIAVCNKLLDKYRNKILSNYKIDF